MPLIKYVEADGREYEAEVAVGGTVMQGAVDNMIDGILAECGGACSCATCHCYVDDAWVAVAGPATAVEKDMLECVVEPKDTKKPRNRTPFMRWSRFATSISYAHLMYT